MTHTLNNTVHISVETNTSTDKYTEALAKSMEYAKELITRRMMRNIFTSKRPEGGNEYVHQAAPTNSDETPTGNSQTCPSRAE